MPDKSRHLSEQQLKAIDLILAGYTDKQVAEQVGVTRQTVNEWKNKNPYFMAELNSRRKAIRDAAFDKLLNLSYKAIDVIEKEIESGNWKLAMEIIKIVGLNSITIGEVDPEAIENDMKLKELFKVGA